MKTSNGEKPKTKPKQKLTIKQKKWIKRTLETGSGATAAEEVYDVKHRDSARSMASQNYRKLKPTMDAIMEKVGITDELLAQKAKEGLDATKVISATIIAGKQTEAGSQTNDFIDVPDYNVRHKYLETSLRLKGYGSQYDAVVNIDNRQVYVMLPTEQKSANNV